MDIVWRSKFGDRGRIQTGQLKAMVSYPLMLVGVVFDDHTPFVFKASRNELGQIIIVTSSVLCTFVFMLFIVSY